MKISLEWLSQYLPGKLDANTAAEALTHGGLPVMNYRWRVPTPLDRGDEKTIERAFLPLLKRGATP